MSWSKKLAGHPGAEFAGTINAEFNKEIEQTHHSEASRAALANHRDLAAGMAVALAADGESTVLVIQSNGHVSSTDDSHASFKAEVLHV